MPTFAGGSEDYMDDQTFDEKSASDWIKTIESEGAKIRDKDVYPKLSSWINKVSPTHVLDLGCGQGVCAERLGAKASLKYFGIDPSPFLIDRAIELYASPARSFLVGSAYEIPLEDSSMDAAFSISVWHLLKDLKTASRELSRVLKQTGEFFIITAHPDYSTDWAPKSTNSDSTDVIYLHSLDDLRLAFEATGLKVRSTENFRNFILIEGNKF